MKVKLTDLLGSRPILQDINNSRMNISVAYKIDKLVDECNTVFTIFEKERIALLEEYAKKDEKANTYTFKSKKKKEEFSKKIVTIVEAEIELDDASFALEDFGEFTIEPGNIKLIAWLIK